MTTYESTSSPICPLKNKPCDPIRCMLSVRIAPNRYDEPKVYGCAIALIASADRGAATVVEVGAGVGDAL